MLILGNNEHFVHFEHIFLVDVNILYATNTHIPVLFAGEVSEVGELLRFPPLLCP